MRPISDTTAEAHYRLKVSIGSGLWFKGDEGVQQIHYRYLESLESDLWGATTLARIVSTERPFLRSSPTARDFTRVSTNRDEVVSSPDDVAQMNSQIIFESQLPV